MKVMALDSEKWVRDQVQGQVDISREWDWRVQWDKLVTLALQNELIAV